MSKRIKVFIVDSNHNFVDTIEDVFIQKQSLGIDIIGKAYTKNEFFYNTEAILNTDIFIIYASFPDGTGTELIDYIKGNDRIKNKPIIFVIDDNTLSYAPKASEKKVDKILKKPINFKKLLSILKELGASSRENRIEDDNFDTETSNNFDTLERLERDTFREIEASILTETTETSTSTTSSRKRKKGIYTFISPSSTGKSPIVVNIGYALRKFPKKKPSVCIVDLNLMFPSISYLFNQEELRIPSRDIYDIAADIAYLNDDLIDKALIKHGPTGIYILNTPTDPSSIQKMTTIKSEAIEKILLQLKSMFDVVLVDTSNDITDTTTVTPIEVSDKIYMVLNPIFLNIVDGNKILYLLKNLEQVVEQNLINKVHLVLNRETKHNTIDDETAKNLLENKKFDFRIPEDNDFITYISKGKFIVDSDSFASHSIIELARHIYPFGMQEKSNKKIIPTLFKKKK